MRPLRPGRTRPVELPSLQSKPAADKSRAGSTARKPGRRSREAHGPGARDAASREGRGTFGDRRAGRDHIVDEKNHPARLRQVGGSGRDADRARPVRSRHVQRPFSPSRTRLSSVGAGPTQQGLDGPAERGADTVGQQTCLIESALTQPRGCQGNGNQHRVFRPDPPGDRRHESSHARRQRGPAGVLETVHDSNGRGSEQEGRVRTDQFVGPVGAFDAASFDREVRQARESAAWARGPGNRPKPALARPAQRRSAGPHRDRARNANGREQRVQQCGRDARTRGGEPHTEALSSARSMDARTEEGMALPSQCCRDSTPCSSSTRRPSSALAPCRRACATQRVPPGR